MSHETHTDHRGWEIDFSTRQSVHPSTRYVPFRIAAATTAANLITLNPRNLPASNWVTNPRVEAKIDILLLNVMLEEHLLPVLLK